MKIAQYIDLIKNMGMRYIVFRVFYEVKSRLGIHKKKFPVNPTFKEFISLEEWKRNTPPFFFTSKAGLQIPKIKTIALEEKVNNIMKGTYTFFSKKEFDLGVDYDWVTNPDSGFKYDHHLHFTEINDFNKVAGDIKYVWEKARFSFVYDVIRYDYNFDEDQSTFVLDQIKDFIDKNPINQGPNYKCSQEISLRILNWTFALYYYRDSEALTDTLFKTIMNAIYWQIHHVYHNINFSRIAVRNNHAITETLLLYVSNLLFPFIPETKKWSSKGKKWFEQEIDYQIYKDGTYLQHSMNYHRIVIQLFTWAIRLSELNEDRFKNSVYDKAEKSLLFLDTCLNAVDGNLPNYGHNDGALFFKLSDADYRDYRAQLDDLRAVLKGEIKYNTDSYNWYGIKNPTKVDHLHAGTFTFDNGGYYIVNENNSKTFIRCASFKDRPAQSDNLHVDLWADGINILRDSGTFKYNTTAEFSSYFNGVGGHNTVSVNGADQMLKGGRFIWFYWIKNAKAKLLDKKDAFVFEGKIRAFRHVGKNITHKRKVTKVKNSQVWEIFDTIENAPDKEMVQYWHINPKIRDKVSIKTYDKNGNQLDAIIEEKWYSSYYGIKESSIRISFKTNYGYLHTKIEYHNKLTNLK
ncbi:alginate lyase family protein [Aureibaculum sp. A20]|uniref:Alginate lyase family protein n=1 Tax=Aureibaculum flavum TaxID=2795986 RepID=A0ABS0WRF4_9FLAO|nr:alginate lyase family protein [Aureibaculum flavum]MBJ2174567.1 alginate lyase family protein [Aureibaculum flavum]